LLLTTLDEEKILREAERRAFRLVGSEMHKSGNINNTV